MNDFEAVSQNENFDELLFLFKQNCTAPQTKKVYANVCEQSLHVKDAKLFFSIRLSLKKLNLTSNARCLQATMSHYFMEVWKKRNALSIRFTLKPKDLLMIVGENDKKMRGRSVKAKMVPYYTREEINQAKAMLKSFVTLMIKILIFSLWKYKAQVE